MFYILKKDNEGHLLVAQDKNVYINALPTIHCAHLTCTLIEMQLGAIQGCNCAAGFFSLNVKCD